jgi:hypothetical protein
MKPLWLLFTITLCSLCFLIACGGGGTPGIGQPPLPLSITSASLPSGSVQAAYGSSLTASGGKAPRSAHTANLLGSGKVLLTGGQDVNGQALASVELFDLNGGSFGALGSMTTARARHAATTLGSGDVLVEGGFDTSNPPLLTAEIFNSNTEAFAAISSMSVARASHTATLLNDGTVLVAGPDQTAELFNPGSKSFVAAGSMTAARELHAATLLINGAVLVTGGRYTNTNSAVVSIASADLYK